MNIRPVTLKLLFVICLVCTTGVGILLGQLPGQESKTILARKSTIPGDKPNFEVDAAWPKPLPNNWVIGDVASISVDSHDNVWMTHRPKTLDAEEKGAVSDPPTGECCVPAPPVIEFDPKGNVLQAWGGPNPAYEWPESEHGINVDYKDNVWITAADTPASAQVLKFTKTGTFIFQIGHQGKSKGSNDTENMGQPAMTVVDPLTNELFVADGHKNRRVIVWDAETGAFKRYWGAYGEQPDDAVAVDYKPGEPLPRQFSSRSSVHCVRLTKTGEVYVCDRNNDRFQVFRKDGTFVKEVVVSPQALGLGSVADLSFSPDERFIYIADTSDAKVWILRRDDDQIVGSFGREGRYAGQLHRIHDMAADSKGNIYTGEAADSKRIQKFKYLGLAKYTP